jgi:light-harvesting complex 1 beta chain
MAENARGSTGYTEAEAAEFMSGYMKGFAVFTLVAVIAHYLTWSWKPWFVA